MASQIPLLKTAKFYVSLAIVLTILGVLFLGYTHYTTLLSEKEAQVQRITQLETKTAAQEQVIKDSIAVVNEWKTAHENFQKTLDTLRDVQLQSAQEIGKLNGIFARHNLGQLAAKKPKLIESRVNNATANSLRMLQCYSGDTTLCASGNPSPGQASSAGTAAPNSH